MERWFLMVDNVVRTSVIPLVRMLFRIYVPAQPGVNVLEAIHVWGQPGVSASHRAVSPFSLVPSPARTLHLDFITQFL